MAEPQNGSNGGFDLNKFILPLILTVAGFALTAWISQGSETSSNLTELGPQISRLQSDVDSLAVDVRKLREDLTGLQPLVAQNSTRGAANADWISRWPTEGELAANVAQNVRLDIVVERVADIEQRLRRIEIDG